MINFATQAEIINCSFNGIDKKESNNSMITIQECSEVILKGNKFSNA
jgi:hypothetical protein